VIVLPARTIFTQYGAAIPDPAIFAAAPPLLARYWNADPLAADTIMNAYAESAASDPRIITPAFDQLFTLATELTCATIWPSPLSDW